jgi:hypothetical protein
MVFLLKIIILNLLFFLLKISRKYPMSFFKSIHNLQEYKKKKNSPKPYIKQKLKYSQTQICFSNSLQAKKKTFIIYIYNMLLVSNLGSQSCKN